MKGSIAVGVMMSCALLGAQHSARAEQSTATEIAPASAPGDLDEIVVNGIKRGELILPTTVNSSAAYGLDLSVMETPRNNTLLSKAQLDALNVQNPGSFSYLTSSSYTDASFGQPNVPRIRGQYGDMFFNGMRDSFTVNGYGAPISFNSVEAVDIVKGPASVQGGPGAGVGGSIDITTKMPTFSKLQGSYELEFDSQQKRRASFDINSPLTATMAGRVSFTSDDSGSYYYGMYFHQQALFAALLTQFTDKYSVLVNAEYVDTRYRENDGVNRVNQALIDNGTYLTGVPAPADVAGFLTPLTLGPGTVQLGNRVIIDEPAGNGAHSAHAKLQIIQTYKASDAFTITNNTFYDYLNRYNEVQDYYADTAKGSYTIENKTDFKLKFATGSVSHDFDAGFTFRYAHVDDIQNYANEPVGIFDLSLSPTTWVFPSSLQAGGGAIPYTAAFNRVQYGVPGRDEFFPNGSVISNLKDAAIFLEHRIKLTPQWSVLYGLRGDVVQLNYSDPLGGPGPDPVTGFAAKAGTGWYGLRNGNISVVYSPSEHISGYLTYNNAQYTVANANDGALGTWGEAPTAQLRQDTELEEAGLKFDLLDKRLFISSAIFKQSRTVPVGQGGLSQSKAHIKGAEIELNYQPDPHFFATASYSYLKTTLDTPSGFYNYPAAPGPYVDGAGVFAVFVPGQKFDDPGVPKHLFNVLANYKHDSGLGAQANIQITGPVETTQSGQLDLLASSFVPDAIVANGGYYKSPQLPWQYTVNAAVFYTFQKYTVKFSVYNLTDRNNLQNDYPFYGNDFLTRVPPRSYDITLTGKF